MEEISTDFISTCAGVGGGWRRLAHINISAGDDCPSGWRKDTYSGNHFCRAVSDNPLMPISLPMELVTRRCVVGQKDTRKELQLDFMDITKGSRHN